MSVKGKKKGGKPAGKETEKGRNLMKRRRVDGNCPHAGAATVDPRPYTTTSTTVVGPYLPLKWRAQVGNIWTSYTWGWAPARQLLALHRWSAALQLLDAAAMQS